MEATNPYQAPQGDLTTPSTDFGEIRLFSAHGRMGRLRFSAYYMLASLAIWGLSALLAAGAALLSLNSPMVAIVLSLLIGLAGMVWLILLQIQRLHDLNRSGWWGLLVMVPLINLLFLLYVTLWPGTQGGNDYGNPPPPNGVWVWIGGILLPLVMIVGLLAAIAIPAYQDYVQRAQMMQQ